ncbi:MAG: cyclic nucleotide-binding domain-containing protein [Caldilineaceae bacterium]
MHEQWLHDCGERIVIAELQGYLFFGTAHRLLCGLHARLAEGDIRSIEFVVLDFRLVTGMDSAATASFLRFLRYLDATQTQLVLTTMAPPLQHVWTRELGAETAATQCQLFPTLDQGLAWCEEALLMDGETGWGVAAPDVAPPPQPSVATFLAMVQASLAQSATLEAPSDLVPLQTRLTRLTVHTGDLVVKEGARLDGIFYIEEGELMAQTKSTDGRKVVMRRMQQGAIFGEISLYTTGYASADVVARQSGTLTHLSRQALRELEASAPLPAIAIHRLVARDLSRKLIQSTRGLGILKR